MPSWLSWFLSPLGLLILSAADSSPLIFLPFANDAVVIYLVARDPDRFWMYPLLATAGATAGTLLGYVLGAKIGDEGLTRFMSRRRLERVRSSMKDASAVPIGLTALIPPPFPFTVFALGAGAFKVRRGLFFGAVVAARLVRFFLEAWLAHRHGSAIVRWMESTPFRAVIWACVVLVIVGTAYSVYQVARGVPKAARA